MTRTRTERFWLGGGVAVALLMAVVGYFFLISPQRAETADVQGQVANAQLQATTLQSRIVSLTAEQKKLPTYRAALAQAQAGLPSLDDQSANPSLLRSLQAIARATSTSVSTLTVAAPSASAAPAAPTGSASGGSASPSASPSSTAASGAVVASSSLYSVAITAAVSGTTSNLTAFLTRLQLHQPRALLVSGVTIGTAGTQPGAHSDQTMTLTMTAFVRPSSAAAPAAATPSASPGTP
ncbi:hypothetical protein [uncultured Jatrophihabitans sp.]|uniref:hypothetical protein n=1 Tax=uncultured Jatrophihabitans sp. TaxID=1610747 RepID=UPI0035CB2CD0